MRWIRCGVLALGLLAGFGCQLLESSFEAPPESCPPDPNQSALHRFFFGTRRLSGYDESPILDTREPPESENQPTDKAEKKIGALTW